MRLELDADNPSRIASLRELVTALHNLEIDHFKHAGSAAREVTPSTALNDNATDARPVTFRRGDFKRRTEP